MDNESISSLILENIKQENADAEPTSSRYEFTENDNESEEFSDDEDDDDENSEYEASTSQSKSTTRKRKKKSSANSKLPPEFKGLMGEANLRLAKGDVETAQKMCFEVIRQVPKAWEPYLTLAQIYETIDPTKCIGYLTVASFLNPANTTTWCRLAELNIQEGNKKEAMLLYTRSLNYNKKDIEIHRKRIKLAEEIGDEPHFLQYQQTLMQALPKENYEEILELASYLTKKYHSDKKYFKALSIMRIPILNIPEHITPDLINITLELLLLTNQYSQCLDIFVNFCNFNFEIIVNDDGGIKINDYFIPENVSIDLKTKFIICAIKLKCFDTAEKLIDALIMMEDVEGVGDLYLDICEALMAENQHTMALKLFIPLKKSKNFSLAGVWLKFAECLTVSSLKEQAVEAYFNVITLAPQHIEVLHPLAELLLEMNRKDEALEVMSYQTTDRLNVGVLLMRARLLKQIGDLDEYWKCIELLLSRHCTVFKNISEFKFALTVMNPKVRIKRLLEFRNEISNIQNENIACIMEPEIENEYELFKEALQCAHDCKEYEKMETLSMMAITSKKFEKFHEEISFFTLIACLRNSDFFHGYYLARDMLSKYPGNNLIFNLFNLFLQQGGQRMSKYIAKIHLKKFDREPTELLEANYDYSVANYVSAMKYYVKEFKETESPYLSFLIGLITLNISTLSRNISEDMTKQLSETTTYLFLNYSRNRSKMAQQEVFYNLGRMYQNMGIMHLAEHYYKKVFNVENHLLNEHPDILCLKREAAFNLHLIYKSSGNFQAARNILLKYLVI